MSCDFIDAASAELDKQDNPYAILLGEGNKTRYCWKCDDPEELAQALEEMAQFVRENHGKKKN